MPDLRPYDARQDFEKVYASFVEIAAAGTSFAQEADLSRAEFELYWSGRGGEQWVACEGDVFLGAYTLRANQPGRGGHVATATYLVSERARGRGVGEALGLHSLERARALGFASMQFNLVVSTNGPAVRLWQRLGFRIVGVLPEVFEHPELGRVDAYVMFQSLGAPSVQRPAS